MVKCNDITLTKDERKQLENFVNKDKHSVHIVNLAKVILSLDRSDGRKPLTQQAIADKVDLSRNTINDIKKTWREMNNTNMFLKRKKRETPPVEAKITGDVKAHIIAVACGEVPEGFNKWTCQLIADKIVELEYISSISAMSVQRVLKKRNFNPTDINTGVFHRNKTRIL